MFEHDQAAGLRALFVQRRPDVIVAFGGERMQASLITTLAKNMAREACGVLLIDGSAGLIAQQLSLRLRYELGHVLAGDKKLDEVAKEVEPGLTLLPALRGLELLPDLTGQAAETVRQQFAQLFRRTESQVDGILVNARPLAAARALDAFSRSAHLLLVLEAGPDSLTAAYQEIKTLRLAHRIEALDVILADGKNPAALAAFWRLKVTSKEFLGVTLHLQTSQGQSSTAVNRVPDALLAHPISRTMERPRGITC